LTVTFQISNTGTDICKSNYRYL